MIDDNVLDAMEYFGMLDHNAALDHMDASLKSNAYDQSYSIGPWSGMSYE